MHRPEFHPETACDLRRTPLYSRLAARGARFGQAAGWERTNWYGDEPIGYSYRKPSWFDAVGPGHRAARERVALFDLSTFTKLDVRGSGALAHVQSLLSSDLDAPVGRPRRRPDRVTADRG
jgi:glycine cleavage system aminomethyltransferase T